MEASEENGFRREAQPEIIPRGEWRSEGKFAGNGRRLGAVFYGNRVAKSSFDCQ
jgi:hypothetical protein